MFPGDSHPAMVCLCTGKPTDTVVMGIHCPGQGDTRWVEVSAKPILRAGEVRPSLVMTCFEDITKVKIAEQNLRQTRRFTELVIRCSQDGIIVYDLELRDRVWNPFMEQLTGVAAQEVLASRRPTSSLFLEAMGGLANRQRARAGETVTSIDFRFSVAKTGKSGWASEPSPKARALGWASPSCMAPSRPTGAPSKSSANPIEVPGSSCTFPSTPPTSAPTNRRRRPAQPLSAGSSSCS